MGLDTTHGCWNGAYSAFSRWRTKIAEVAGFGNLDDYTGYGGGKVLPPAHPLTVLLDHSDCDGEIAWQECGPLADALEKLMPSLTLAGDGGGHIGSYAEKTRQFINGLREAALAEENVEFQ